MMMNDQVFNQMKQNMSKDNEQTQLLIRLAEEVMHDQDLEEVKEDDNVSKSSNSMWNKTMLSKVLKNTGLGSKQQLKTMIKEKRFAEVLERCLRAMIDLQNSDMAAETEFMPSQFSLHSPEHRWKTLNSSQVSGKRPQLFELSAKPMKLNVSQIQERLKFDNTTPVEE